MSDMSRWAIEYGPHEPETYRCNTCDGTGSAYAGRLASRLGPCRECDGTGEVVIDPDDWEDTRDHDPIDLYDEVSYG